MRPLPSHLQPLRCRAWSFLPPSQVAGGTVTVDVKLPGLGRPRGGSKPIKVAVDEVVRQDEARAAAAAAGAASAAAGREGGRGGAYAALLGRVDEALAALEAGDRER
jgi:hypothetical protein